jgi:protease-4
MTEAELAQLNQTVGQLYTNFTAKVAEGRRLTPEAADAVARGRVWSGNAAKARGLVDELGGLARAVEVALTKSGLDESAAHELVLFPPGGLFRSLTLNWSRAEVPSALELAATLLELPHRWTPALLHLATRRGALLQLCPFWD